MAGDGRRPPPPWLLPPWRLFPPSFWPPRLPRLSGLLPPRGPLEPPGRGPGRLSPPPVENGLLATRRVPPGFGIGRGMELPGVGRSPVFLPPAWPGLGAPWPGFGAAGLAPGFGACAPGFGAAGFAPGLAVAPWPGFGAPWPGFGAAAFAPGFGASTPGFGAADFAPGLGALAFAVLLAAPLAGFLSCFFSAASSPPDCAS